MKQTLHLYLHQLFVYTEIMAKNRIPQKIILLSFFCLNNLFDLVENRKANAKHRRRNRKNADCLKQKLKNREDNASLPSPTNRLTIWNFRESGRKRIYSA